MSGSSRIYQDSGSGWGNGAQQSASDPKLCQGAVICTSTHYCLWLFRNCKLRGEWTELQFMLRAIEQGLRFSKPWGEIRGYDFAVERNARFLRVQVKSTICEKPEGGYSCILKDSHGAYHGNPFDFRAPYVMPEDT